MPLNTTRAIVLRADILGEQDKMIFLLSEEAGIIKAVAPGAVKHGNRFGALLEPFTEGQFFYYWKQEKELVTLSKGEIHRTFFDIISLPQNIFHFSLMAEIVLKFVPHHHHDPRLYRLLVSLLEICSEGVSPAMLLPYFLVWMLRIEGLLFNPSACSNCHSRFLERAYLRKDFRGLLCQSCRSGEIDVLEKEELDFIAWTRRHPAGATPAWQGMRLFPHLVRILVKQIEYHGEFSLVSSQFLPEFK